MTATNLLAGDWVLAHIPVSWWIADTAGDGPSVWSPRPGKPRPVISEDLAGPELWAVLARALPDRGICYACTAVPCIDHGGEE